MKINHLLILPFFLLFITCKKSAFKTNLTVKLTDDPAPYLQVNIDLLSMEAHYGGDGDTNDAQGWVNIPVNAGIYDLLKLQNGIDTILASNVEIPAGHLNQIRLILGNNNSVKEMDSTMHNLKVPSGSESGLKIKLNERLRSNEEYEILLDFDAGKSVLKKGNGDYSLKPVIKVLSVIEL